MADENTNDGLATRSATALAAGIRAKEWSSRELLDLYLDRIDRLNGPLNAVVTLDADRARDAADAADAALARGDGDPTWHSSLNICARSMKRAACRSISSCSARCARRSRAACSRRTTRYHRSAILRATSPFRGSPCAKLSMDSSRTSGRSRT